MSLLCGIICDRLLCSCFLFCHLLDCRQYNVQVLAGRLFEPWFFLKHLNNCNARVIIHPDHLLSLRIFCKHPVAECSQVVQTRVIHPQHCFCRAWPRRRRGRFIAGCVTGNAHCLVRGVKLHPVAGKRYRRGCAFIMTGRTDPGGD